MGYVKLFPSCVYAFYIFLNRRCDTLQGVKPAISSKEKYSHKVQREYSDLYFTVRTADTFHVAITYTFGNIVFFLLFTCNLKVWK